MKAKDLMIGDWVAVHRPGDRHEQVRVKSVIGNGTIEARTSDGLVAIGELAVELIPLTVEILEKNGFEELMSEAKGVAAMFGRKVEHTGVWMYCIPDTFDSVSCVPERKLLRMKVMEGGITDLHNLQYVHELQHFLRLFGIEKEIIL